MASLNGEIFDIFSRLPAKSIIKFQSVCKDVKSYASESFFLKQHCQNMLEKDDSGILLVQYEHVELCGSASCFGVPPESLEFLSSTTGVLASSNGLVCGRMMTENEAPLFICNPVTKSWVSIPAPDGWNSSNYFAKIAFECLNDDDYFLMIITGDPNGDWSEGKFLTRIYAPKEGVWKEAGNITFGVRNMAYDKRPVYINSGGGGVVYFMSDSSDYLKKTHPYYWPYVVGYDIKTSHSRILRIPKEARRGVIDNECMLNIFKWVNFDRGLESTVCLIKLRNTVFTVWVLEDLEWKKVLKKPAWLMGVKEPNLSIMGFTIVNGKQLVMVTKRRMYRYDLSGESNSEKAIEICKFGCKTKMVNLLPYSNTLRPCGDGAMPVPASRRYRRSSSK